MKQRIEENNGKRQIRGITLIALVITIIVLLILVGVTILALTGDEGILTKTTDAKDANSKASAEEQVKLAVAGSYGKNGKLDYKELKDNLNKIPGIEGVPDEITDDSFPLTVKVNGYDVQIEKNGKTTAKGKNENTGGWYKTDDGTITNGKNNVKIGDYVDYKPSAGTYSSLQGTYISGTYASVPETITQGSGYSKVQEFDTSTYTGGWRVLGVDDKTGELLLISADPIQTSSGSDYYLRGYTGVTYGPTELDNICAIYGKGRGATKARSVTVEDINNITGYDPTNTGDGAPFGSGEIYQYGNEVTYNWGADDTRVTSSWGIDGSSNGINSNYATYGFNYPTIENNKIQSWYKSSFSSNAEICKLPSTCYEYYPHSLTTDSSISGDLKGISTTSTEYLTLFCNSSETKVKYWLASSYLRCTENGPFLGLQSVRSDGKVYFELLYASAGLMVNGSSGVRAVVYLKSDIQFTEGDGKMSEEGSAYTY